MATSFPYAPWEFYNPPTSTNPDGFDYDMSQAIGAKLGIKTLFINTPFDSLILSVQGGKNDMIMGDMYDNPVREKVLTFVDYAYDGTAILVLKGNPQGITNLDSLAGKTVGCLEGSVEQVQLTGLNETLKSAGKPQVKMLVQQGTPAGLLALKSGRAAAMLLDESAGSYLVKSPGGGSFEMLTDPAAPHGYDPSPVGIGILKTNPQLVTAVQKALQDLINEGSYQKIVASWGLLPVASAQINQGAKPIPTNNSSSASPTP